MDPKPRGHGPTIVEKDEKPDIEIKPNILRMRELAIEALAADEEIFQRGGSLVHTVNVPNGPEPVDGAIAIRPTTTPTIKQMKVATLRAHLSADAYWKKHDDGKWKDVTPPDSVVQAVMDAGEYPGIPFLTNVITSPTLRADGTVLQQPGYDRATGLLYKPGNTTYPIVDEKPTKDQCIWQKEALLEVVRDFPFSKPHHISAWFAAMLTCVARAAIDGPCPLFAVDATTAGTGKGRLVQATARLAFGQDVAAFSQPDDEDEIRKRITSILLGGDPCVLIDNVNKPLGGAALDAVLTSTTWADRMLGSTATIKVPNLAIWWATGNNLALLGDMARRTMQIRLESPLEKPEERENFAHPNLLAWIDRERPKLVFNALTILRGYFVAGKPHRGKPWGSFESWSELIPGVLRWLDMPDPQLARATADDMVDEHKNNLITVILAVEKLEREKLVDRDKQGMTARSIIARLFPPASATSRTPRTATTTCARPSKGSRAAYPAAFPSPSGSASTSPRTVAACCSVGASSAPRSTAMRTRSAGPSSRRTPASPTSSRPRRRPERAPGTAPLTPAPPRSYHSHHGERHRGDRSGVRARSPALQEGTRAPR